jgi:NADH dehydrogenase/putative oxidoreductase
MMPQPHNQPRVTAAHRRYFGTTSIGIALGRVSDTLRVIESIAGPVIDLVIRLHLAQIFFVSAVLKLADWKNAIALSTYEYPVSWMDPVTAAYTGVVIELLGSVLLATGLCTRVAAASMLALSIVIQFNYVALDSNLFWIALLGWFIVHGANAWSLDRLLSHGLSDSAIPFAAPILRFNAWFTARASSVYKLGFRFWLAIAMLLAAGVSVKILGMALLGTLSAYLPVKSASMIPAPLLIFGAAMIGLGMGTRFVAVTLIAIISARAMHNPEIVNEIYWTYSFALCTIFGPGKLSADALLRHLLAKRYPQLEGLPAFALEGLPRVVIVGAGFGGIACASALRNVPVAVTLIDKHNYHLFQPLLYQVATTMLAPNDIAAPVRSMFRDSFNIRVLLGEVDSIDPKEQAISLARDMGGKKCIPYDYLVLATGASHSYFGRDEWAPYAPGLKRIEDATDVRRRLLSAFELAESADTDAEREALLTFLIVGGGPTGVELAGAIVELARHGMEQEFRHIDPARARVILVQAAPRILPSFSEAMSEKAKRSLERLGVEVRLNAKVEHIDALGVKVSSERVASRTVFWAAGVVASDAARWLNAKADKAGRVCVGPDLSVPGLPNVFAIGDTALSNAWDCKPVPGLAPAAKQGGAYVASLIRKRVLGEKEPPAFRYRHLGSLATIGRKSAIADFGRIKLSGALAWWLWGAVHVAFLAGMRNRVAVMLDWFWAYLTFRSSTRLITGDAHSRLPQETIAQITEDVPPVAMNSR